MKSLVAMSLSLLVVLSVAVGQVNAGDVYVPGYFRSSGTYVAPHYRSAPDGNFWNNWSTYPNVNPYTGKSGTRVTPSYESWSSTGSRAWVTPSYGFGRSYPSYSGRTWSTRLR